MRWMTHNRLSEGNGILLPILFWPTGNCSSDWDNVLKFDAEGREFAKTSLKTPIFQTVKCQNNFW